MYYIDGDALRIFFIKSSYFKDKDNGKALYDLNTAVNMLKELENKTNISNQNEFKLFYREETHKDFKRRKDDVIKQLKQLIELNDFSNLSENYVRLFFFYKYVILPDGYQDYWFYERGIYCEHDTLYYELDDLEGLQYHDMQYDEDDEDYVDLYYEYIAPYYEYIAPDYMKKDIIDCIFEDYQYHNLIVDYINNTNEILVIETN